jgi:hypothetical protein
MQNICTAFGSIIALIATPDLLGETLRMLVFQCYPRFLAMNCSAFAVDGFTFELWYSDRNKITLLVFKLGYLYINAIAFKTGIEICTCLVTNFESGQEG